MIKGGLIVRYEKPEMDIVEFVENVYMLNSVEQDDAENDNMTGGFN